MWVSLVLCFQKLRKNKGMKLVRVVSMLRKVELRFSPGSLAPKSNPIRGDYAETHHFSII